MTCNLRKLNFNFRRVVQYDAFESMLHVMHGYIYMNMSDEHKVVCFVDT